MVRRVLLLITNEWKKIEINFFSDERREPTLYYDSFSVHKVIEHNILWVLEKQSECSKTQAVWGSLRCSCLAANEFII